LFRRTRAATSFLTTRVRRRLDKQDDLQQSDWIWVTTLSLAQFPVDRIAHLGHQWWDIENYGFNELANEWHSDHVFKHDPGAVECFLLVAFLAYNIFHVFLARNVKPAVRQGKAEIFWARLIASTVRWSPPACRPEVFRFPRPILLLAPGIFIAIFPLVEPSNGVANSVPPSKKPCELAVPSVARPKMLKTFTNPFSPSSGARCGTVEPTLNYWTGTIRKFTLPLTRWSRPPT